MSLENEDQRITDSDSEKFDAVLTRPKISYTRDFLLSLSSLDVCKKLPSGFDESLLSEFGEGSESGLDRPRNTSSLPFQGFRRTQYSSSPPTQGESSDNSRGFHGRWESWRNDRDSDSQSDKDSDSGRRYGHQSIGSWHTREQDGLLGSGSLARPFGYTSGMSAPKTRPNEQYQPNKSNEPYHPPRPYKAVPHTRRDTDSYNDETFGLVESTSQDRAEEERKRRASFETMRKGQQKILRDKQNSNLGKHKDGSVADICEVLDDSRDEKELDARNNETELSAGIHIVSSNDLEKHYLPSNSLASRPLVPPGFKNNILETNTGLKSLIRHHLSEVPESVMGTTPLDFEINLSPNGAKDDLEHQLAQGISFADGKPAAGVPHAVYQEENVKSLSSLDAPIHILSKQDQFSLSNHFNSQESLNNLEKVKLNGETLGGIVGDLNANHSTSAIEEFLDATLSIGDNGSTTADHYGMPNAPNSVQSSKFAQWFFEEETKHADVPSETLTDLLSIIVNGDKGRHKVSGMEATEHFPPDFTYKTLEQLNKVKFEGQSPSNEISNQPVINNNEDIIPLVLTCEDLEQSILSEYSGNSTIMQPLGTENTEHKHSHVDGYASSHLLSLLQKGTESSINPVVNINLADNLPGSPDNGLVGTSSHKLKWEKNNDNLSNSVNTLMLEALFGTAFMNELQSVDAPVSVQRGSTGSAQVDTSDPPGLPLPVSDVDSSPIISISGPQRPSHDYGVLTSNHMHQTRLTMSQNWHVSCDPQNDMISSLKHTEAATKNIGRQAIAIQLPEKNPISSNDPQNQWKSKLMSLGSSSNSKNSSLDEGKLLPFSDVKNQLMVGSEILPSTHGHHEQLMSQIPFRSPQMQQSFTQLQTPKISSVGPLYHHLDSHPVNRSSDMTFLGPESIFSHDSSPIHQFPSNVSRPSLQNTRDSGFEIPSHPAILRHQMQLPGNHPFMFPDLSRGGPFSHHGNQSTVFMQENQIRHLPFDPRMANIGSRGVPFSDVNSVGNPPEAFQRLIEIELRANSKQSQTHVPRRNQGFHGLEPDMGYQYG